MDEFECCENCTHCRGRGDDLWCAVWGPDVDEDYICDEYDPRDDSEYDDFS